MHLREGQFEKAHQDFFEAFKVLYFFLVLLLPDLADLNLVFHVKLMLKIAPFHRVSNGL